jgi:hypothetical protein
MGACESLIPKLENLLLRWVFWGVDSIGNFDGLLTG